MLIFAIDDEPKMLDMLHTSIAEAEQGAEIMDFGKSSEVLDAIEKRQLRPDIVFSDIRMPGIDGLELAVKIKTYSPNTKIIFVTGYSDYALDAFEIHANGYIMKPIESERIRAEIDSLVLPFQSQKGKLRVKCFGIFEIFWQDKPLDFERRQTKELFAYLIDREGAYCYAEEVIDILWEDETDMKKTKHRLRNLINDLKNTFHNIGCDDVLIRKSGSLAINCDMVDCDYYRMLKGDMSAVNLYRGEYMKQYDWAQLTEGKLHFLRLFES